MQLKNVYESVVQGLPRSNNAVERWHRAFNNHVSIKHPSITRLAKCILREQARFEIDIERFQTGEQARFEIDIERLQTGEQPKKKKKNYQKVDARLKRIVLSYDVNNIEEYLTRIAMNLKIGC